MKKVINLIDCIYLRFDYYGVGTDDLSKVKQTLFMFIDLFGLEKFDYNTLVRSESIKINLVWFRNGHSH